MHRDSTHARFAVAAMAATVLAAAVAAGGEPAPRLLTLDAGPHSLPMALAFSPDGRSLAAVALGPVAPAQGPAVAGRHAAAAATTGPTASTTVSLWDTATGSQKWQQEQASAYATMMGTTIAFSPDGQLVAVPAGFPVSTVALLDARSGKARTVLKIGQFAANIDFRMAFSADGKYLAGCAREMPPSSDALRLWQCASGRLVSDMKLPPVSPEAMLESPESMLGNMPALYHYPAFSPDGRLLAVTTGLRAELWDVRNAKLRAAIPLVAWRREERAMGGAVVMGDTAHSWPWPAPLFSPDGKTLIAAAATMEGARVGPGGQADVASGNDDAIFVIDAETGKTRHVIRKFPDRFLAFLADGKSVAGAASRGAHLKLALCNLETQQVKTVLEQAVPSKKTIEQIAFSPDGSKLATMEGDLLSGASRQDAYSVHVWDTRTGEQLAELEGRARPAAGAGQGRPGKTPTAGRSPAEAKPGARGSRPGKTPAAADWAGNMLGLAAQGEFEAFSGMIPPRLLFSPDATRLALINGGFGPQAAIDLWTLAGPVSPHDSLSAAPRAEARPSPAEPERKEAFRTWTSADGKFTVEAQLLRADGDAAVLKKKSGREVKVPLDKLREEDRQYVEEHVSPKPDASEEHDP
jgi:WD40 repeat protein